MLQSSYALCVGMLSFRRDGWCCGMCKNNTVGSHTSATSVTRCCQGLKSMEPVLGGTETPSCSTGRLEQEGGLRNSCSDNKLHQQWEERFKAPHPPPRPISPLPRTPPSTPPPTGRNCIVMTAIDAGRKRKAPAPEVQPKRRHLSHWKNKNKNGLTFNYSIRTRNSSAKTSLQEPRMYGFHH